MPEITKKALTSRILKNTFFNSISRFISGVSGFILTPFLLKFLGLSLFGVWSFLFVLISYLGLLDLGLAEATVKFTAEYKAKKDLKAISNLLAFSFIFYLFLGVFLALLHPLIGFVVRKTLPVPANLPLAVNTFILTAIVFSIFNKFSNLLNSLYIGFQKMELVALRQFIYDGLLIGSVLFCIYTKQPVFIVFWIPALVQTITFLFQFFLTKLILPQFHLNLSLINRHFLKKILKMGGEIQASISANVLTTQITKSLIFVLGSEFLGIYELAFKAVAFLKALPTIFLQPLFPAISELDILDKTKRNRLISQGTKYLSFITYPLFFLSFIFMPSLMKLWLGKEISLAVFAARILLIGFLPDTLVGLVSTALTAVGKVFVNVEYALLILFLNSLGMYLLLPFKNFSYLVFVFPVAVFAGFLWKVWRFSQKVFKLSPTFFKKNFLHAGIVCLLATGASFSIYKTTLSNINPILALIIACFVFGIFYLVILFIAKFFTDEDWKLFKKL